MSPSTSVSYRAPASISCPTSAISCSWCIANPTRMITCFCHFLTRCGVSWRATRISLLVACNRPWLHPSNYEFKIVSKEIFDSFLLPKRDNSGDNEFEYMIFAWNGKTANPLVKAQALSNAFELENLLNKGKDPFLQVHTVYIIIDPI